MSGTDQTQTAFTAEDDAVLRAKIALVECINTVEKWGSDGAGEAIEETDLWNSELPLSERLRVVANEVATVEKLNRSNTRRKLHAAHDKGQEPGSKDPSKGPVHRGAGADGGGQTADAGSGASVQHANVGHADEAATAADGLAAAVAAVKEAPEKNKKKMAVRRQTRDSQPEAANETCMQRTKRYALTTFGLQTIFSILLLLIGLVYLTQRLQWTWQYSLYWCMMTALTVGYGDSPRCSTDVELPLEYVNGSVQVNGSGDFNGSLVELEPPPCYGTGDRWEDMLFTMIFAFFSVTIIDSIIIEVLDRIERKERKLFAKVQRKLLELYTQAANHAAKMDEQAEAATSPDKMEQMMDDSLLVLDEEEADDADGADGAGGADRVYRNELHRLLSWLYRMSNHYANTRDAIIWVILVFIGVGFYMGHYQDSTSQDITFMSSLYWVIITGLAVGYGDFHPDDNIGYMFNFFYSFILFLWTFRIISQFIKAVRRPSSYKQVLQSTFDIDRMKSFDRDDDGVVTRDEYLAAVLVMLGQTDLETCDLILKYYDILDHDGDQVLTYEDIRIANERGVANMNHFEAASKAQKAESKRKSTFRKAVSSSTHRNGNHPSVGKGARSQSAPPAPLSTPPTPLSTAPATAAASRSVQKERVDSRFQEFLVQMEGSNLLNSSGLASLRSTLSLVPAESAAESPARARGRAAATTITTSSV